MNREANQPEMDDATLDALLAEARWPQIRPESADRVERYWHSIRRPLWTWRALGAAAALLVASGIAVAVLVNSRAGDPHESISHVDPAPIPKAVTNVSPAILPIVGRPPTPLESVIFAADDHPIRRRPAKPATPDRVQQAVSLAVVATDADKFADAAKLIDEIPPAERESRLFEAAKRGAASDRVAAAKLLAAIATPDAMPMLLELLHNSTTHDAAIDGLARVAPSPLLAKLAQASPGAPASRKLIAGIIRAGDTHGYLDLVADRTMTATAIAALDLTPNVSTDPFFAALYDPQISVRQAAARVLGRIDGPATTARLVAMAQQNQSRREALIALADSRGPEAQRFVAAASMDNAIGPTMRSILLEQLSNKN